jgi:predicted neuraminidase
MSGTGSCGETLRVESNKVFNSRTRNQSPSLHTRERFSRDCLLVLIVTLSCFPIFNRAHTQSRWERGIIKNEFIFKEASFKECHASTLAETKEGLVVAFFAGTEEKNPDVGIWLSRFVHGQWTPPSEVTNGLQPDGARYPCWNPVLFHTPTGQLLLFYKVGPSPSEWWGMLIHSGDGGKTWTHPVRLPDGILGPIKNKPILFPPGELVAPSSTEDNGWSVHLEFSSGEGKSWGKTGPLNGSEKFSAIQPTLLMHPNGHLQMLCRSKESRIVEAWSSDKGRTWTDLTATMLPNPNSGIDAVTLIDGRQLLVYNHSGVPRGKWGGPRSPLNISISRDGESWYAAAVLEHEPGEFSYPAVIQTSDSLVHITYTWKRSAIKHVIFDPRKCELQKIEGGRWPQ